MPKTRATIERELTEVADELDALNARQVELWEKRVRLWRQGKGAGLNATDMGRISRVQAVTVRQRLMKAD